MKHYSLAVRLVTRDGPVVTLQMPRTKALPQLIRWDGQLYMIQTQRAGEYVYERTYCWDAPGNAPVEAGHLVAPSCGGERCGCCGVGASHKVEETRFTDAPRHPLTQYLCCEHFRFVMGPAACAPGPEPPGS